jgi:hypothetical protein
MIKMPKLKRCALLMGVLSAQVLTLPWALAVETAPGITDLTKPFNEYSWVTAHNGYLDNMKNQLDLGVRGFMLDLHPGNQQGPSTAYLCHTTKNGTCNVSSDMKFADALNNVFLPFLHNEPNAVVTLMLENYVDQETLGRAFDAVPDLANWVFDPRAYQDARGWPTLKQMIDSGKRLILLTDSQEGDYSSHGKVINVLRDRTWENQNHWSLGTTMLKSEWSCPSRWGPYSPAVTAAGFSQWPKLFVMNQFRSWGGVAPHAANIDNNLTYLERRVDTHCASALGTRTAPSFIAINFNQGGDAFSYAAALTQGGYYFYEQNNANPRGDTTCVLPASRDYDVRLPAFGCENDEARSLKIRGVTAGTRISLFDSASGSTQDDYARIDVKRDVGINESVTVGTFETDYETADFKVTYIRNNGLDGKVSRIIIGKTPPANFSDASVVLYEGNGATQNIVCSVSLANSSSFNFGGACDNDEARSAQIMKAKAGTRFIVYGNRDQNENQGYAQIDVLRDITQAVVIGSFEQNYDGGSWKITRGGPTGQLDGRISSMKIQP